jgi:uncharacterized repeat protein (TIGR01451 family)
MPRVALFGLALAVMASGSQGVRAQNDDGSKPIQRTTDEIMKQAALRERPRQIQDREIKKKEVNRSRLPQNPKSPLVSRVGGPEAVPEIGRPVGPPRAPQTVSTPNFTSLTITDAVAVPPDTMGAVGPTNFLTDVNARIRVHNKTTGAIGALDTDDFVFWAPVAKDPANGFQSDPRVRFDRLTDRWFMSILDIPPNVGATGSRILLAMSDGPNITASTVWKYFYFDQDLASPAGDTGCLSDYPTLGIDVNALYIGASIFCGPDIDTLEFSNNTAWVVRKSTLLNPATPANLVLTSGAVKAFRTLLDPFSFQGLYVPQGADNYDPGATKGYFIAVDGAGFGTLVVREVNNPGGGSPTLSANQVLTVPTTVVPIEVLTPGGGRPLDGIDDRLMAAHLRDGKIWTSQQIEVNGSGVATTGGGRNGTRWYAIDVSGGAPALTQAGTVFDAGTLSYWMGTIMVSGQGHAALGFTAASATVQPAAATVGRLAGDPLGTTQGAPVIYHAGEADYVDNIVSPSIPIARWGDYSMTTLDPCDDMTMWTTQEFSAIPASYPFNWGARVVRLLAPLPAVPSSAVPPMIAAGQSSVSVTISGNTAGGAGFYDTPATGMSACRTRIAGLVGNGVTVNSVTFVNPGTVTLDLNTTAASVGPAAVTITNPDGQSAVGSSVLKIFRPPTKTVSGTPNSGGTITYTVTLIGTGLVQGDNPGNEFTDVLPVGLTLLSAIASSGIAVADFGTNTVTWNGSIPASGTVTISIQAIVNAASGAIISNQGTISYDSDGNGTNDVVASTDDPGLTGHANPTVFEVGTSYYTVSPCRVLDTRNPNGPYGGPALAAGADRTFTIGAQCNIPATARAVAVNITVTQATTAGNLGLFPAGTPAPLVSTINYVAGLNRANNAVVPLNALAEMAVHCGQASGTVHFILDVNGYFQ